MNEILRNELSQVLAEPLGFDRDALTLQPRSHAAVLIIFRGPCFADAEVLLTLRSMNLNAHQGEVAFPGGGVEEQDEGSNTRTALRETFEEVGLPSDCIEVLGELPSLLTITGRSQVIPVLGVLRRNQELKIEELEVSIAEWVRVSELRATRKIETRLHQGISFEMPYFDWRGEKMWGLTALIFDLILRRHDTVFPCV